MNQSKCVAYPPYTGDKRLVLEGLMFGKVEMLSIIERKMRDEEVKV